MAVSPERLKWSSEEKAVEGIKFFGDRIGALKSGAGPLTVYATYFKQESNHVVVKTVDADPNLKLAVEVDRTLRLTGEPGKALLTATGSTGDVRAGARHGVVQKLRREGAEGQGAERRLRHDQRRRGDDLGQPRGG